VPPPVASKPSSVPAAADVSTSMPPSKRRTEPTLLASRIGIDEQKLTGSAGELADEQSVNECRDRYQQLMCEIAEADFELRGPGDVLGTRQHGELPLKVADLAQDAALLREARDVAFKLVESGRFDEEDYAPLKVRVLERFRESMDLAGSG